MLLGAAADWLGVEMVLRWRKGEMVQGEVAQSCSTTGEKGAEMVPHFALVQMAAAAGLVGLKTRCLQGMHWIQASRKLKLQGVLIEQIVVPKFNLAASCAAECWPLHLLKLLTLHQGAVQVCPASAAIWNTS